MSGRNAEPIALLDRALGHASASRVSEAKGDVRRALASAPDSTIIGIIAARLLVVVGDGASAMDELDRIGRAPLSDRSRAVVLGWRFEIGRRLGRHQEAVDAIDEAIRCEPRLRRHVEATRFLVALRDFDRAIAHATAARSIDAGSAELSFLHAGILAAAEDMEAAAAVLHALASDTPDDPALLVRAGRGLLEVGGFDDAGTHLCRALELDPSCAGAHVELGRLALWRATPAEAVRRAEAALAIDAGGAGARAVRGGARLLAGELAAALRDLDDAVEQRPRDAEPRLLRAEARMRSGALDGAFDDVSVAENLVPTSTLYFAAQVLHLEIQARQGDSRGLPCGSLENVPIGVERLAPAELGHEHDVGPDALAARFERVRERLGGNRSPFATFLADGGRLEALRLPPDSRAAAKDTLYSTEHQSPGEIRRRFDEVLSAFPESPQPYCYRGELELWLGRYEHARLDFEQALRISKGARWATIGLGASHLLEGDPRRALEIWDSLIDSADVPGPTLYVYRGEARRLVGDVRGALEDLGHSCGNDPTRIGAWVDLALAHADAGAWDEHAEVMRHVFAAATGLMSDAARELGFDCLGPATALDRRSSRQLLERALIMMRGNRSSSCRTYFTAEGELRFVPPHRANRTDHDLKSLRRAIDRLAARDGPPL